MSINLKALIFIIVLHTQVSSANFVIDKEYCTLSNTFSGVTSDNLTYDGVINLTFTSSDAALPLINVSRLSRNINPTNMSLSWPNADLVDSRQRPIFVPDFQKRIETEINNTFDLVKEDVGGNPVFYSRPYGFYRFQNLIALFLSQNDVTLTFKNQNSDQDEKLVIPLQNSDVSFREVARHCFSNSVSEYIGADFTRTDTTDVNYVWSIGYGLTSYFILEDLLPEQVKFPNDITKNLSMDSRQSYDQFNQLFALLNTKLRLVNSIRAIELNSTYVNSQSAIRQSADKIVALANTRDQLGGPQGQLKLIETELKELGFKLLIAEQALATYSQQFNPVQEQKSLIEAKINLLSETLSLMDYRIQVTRDLNKQYESNIKTLSEVLNLYAEQYSSQITEKLRTEVLGTPYSIEQILESNTKLEANQAEQRKLQRNLALILSVTDEMNKIVESHKLAFDIDEQRSALKVQKVAKLQAYNQNQLDQVLFQEALGQLNFDQITDLIKLDREAQEVEVAALTGAERESRLNIIQNLKISDLKKLTQDLIRTSYDRYDAFIDQTKSSQLSLLFLNVVCKSNYLVRSYQGQCLDPLYLNDIKKVEVFVDQLSSQTLTDLGFQITQSRSLIQKFEASRTQVISEKIISESGGELAQNVIQKWSNVLYLRWKYFAIRSLGDDKIFSFDLLTNALNQQKLQMTELKAAADTIEAEVIAIDLNINSLNSEFLVAEASYFENLSINQTEILREVYLSGISAADLNLECIIDVQNVDLCNRSFDSVSTQLTTSNDTLTSDIKQAILLLLITSSSQIETLNENLKISVEALDGLINEKNDYIQKNNYNQVLASYENSVANVRSLELRLKRFAEQKANAEQRRAILLVERFSVTTKYTDVVAEIKNITDQIRPTLNQLKPLCDEKNILVTQLQNNEAAIHELLSLTQQPSNINSICQIEF